MNDFGDIENELKKLRPLPPSARLAERVANAMRESATEDKIVRPHQFRLQWLSLGIGLAAAAVVLIFLHIDSQNISRQQSDLAVTSPAPQAGATPPPAIFLPAGATQVVYHTRDEGLFFPAYSERPVRRVRSVTHESLQWRNPATGASLRVSYPTERVELVPVSGQ